MDKIKTDENIEKKVSEEEPVDLIELVRSKHEKSNAETEHFGDVLVIQITLCIIILLILAIINIIDSQITGQLIDKFKSLTSGETEKVFERAVFKVMDIING